MMKFKELAFRDQFVMTSAFLVTFCLVIRDQFISPFILIFLLSTIPFWKKKSVSRPEFIFSLIPISLYLLYVLSLSYTTNWGQVDENLMTKLSLLLFPIAGIVVGSEHKRILFGAKWGLIAGIGISITFSLMRFLVLRFAFGTHLTPSEYALNMHTSYLALLIIIACVFLYFEKEFLGRFHWIRFLYFPLALLSVIYFRSLGAIICLGVIFSSIPIWYAFKKGKKRWLFLFPVYGTLLGLLVFFSPQLRNDVNTTKNRTFNWAKAPEKFLSENKNDLESNTVRLVTWTLSSSIIKEHPMGVGIGDRWDELEFNYRERGFTFYANKKLNVHNQFLETGVTVGVLGIFLLMLFFFYAIYLSWKNNQITFLLIGLSLFVSFLFESMLERSVGVILISLYAFLLVQSIQSNKMEKSSETRHSA